MADKIKSEIIRIDLTGASYKDTHAYIEPSYVNFFFGNNGVGKSTIAKAIKNGINLTYAPGRSSADYLPLIYDQEFIDENFHSYRNMKGVFTLNAKNAKTQNEIELKTSERTETKKRKNEAVSKQAKATETRTKLQKGFYKTCWDREKTLREKFPKTQAGKGKSEAFSKEILKHTPKDMDIDELCRLYDSAFSDAAKKYPIFARISNTSVLDELSDKDILSTAIVNSADTELAVFLRKIGATEWMRKGHDEYTHLADGSCPYCGQSLPVDFEKIFIDSFDTQYQDNLQRLRTFFELYKNTANTLFMPLQALPSEIYPGVDTKPYTEKLGYLKSTIQSNIETIKAKVANPAVTVALEEIKPILEELAEIIKSNNKLINANNNIVAAGPKKQEECTNQVFSLAAHHLKDVIDSYNKSLSDVDEEIKNCENEIKSCETVLKQIESDLHTLRKSTVETDTAKDSINNMLRDSGMQGFRLQPKSGVANVYEVRRPDGTIADNLSEGEKNFIAFLYFYHLVYGSASEDGDPREKIVVIDDPVSSMDSGSLFIVSTLVKQMIEVCRNNADNRNRVADGNFIKQIFVLTHNAYFHNEITYSYVSKYEYVSFYLIRKLNSKSSIRLCDDVNPNIPTERMNINPVKNSYAALWDEYKEVKSAVPLMNVIRRILEYYFLQLCGYEGSTLRRVILVEGKSNGRFTNDDGRFDEEKFQLASAMLSYINANSIGMNDGRDFVEECLDADECRNIFEMIFDAMKQKQHYDMMIRNQ